MARKQKRKINLLPTFLILILVGLICVMISFTLLYIQKRQLMRKDALLPENAISTYIKNINQKRFDEIFETSLKVTPHLNKKEDYTQKLSEIYQNVSLDKVSYIKVTDDTYQVVYQNQLLSTLKLVKENNRWLASTLFNGDYNYSIEVPVNQTLSINGLAVGESYITEKNVLASNFKASNQSNGPKVNIYTIENLISEPTIETNASNSKIMVDALTHHYYVGEESNDASIIAQIEKVAETIAKYPTRDTTLAAVSSVALTSSDFYARIKSLDTQWYAKHNVAQISNMQVVDMIKQSDNSVLANVTFDFLVSSGSASKTYHIGYQLSLVNVSGTYQLAGIAIDNTLNPNYQE